MLQKQKRTLGDRAFQVASPGLWNGVPNDIRNAKTMDVFKSLVKTHLYYLYHLVIFRILHFLPCLIFSLYIRYGLDSFIILDLLFYYCFNGTCKVHLNVFI